MTSPEFLSWENFRSTVFLPGEQRVHRVTEKPRIEMFGDGVANRIGLLIETSAGTTLPEDLSRLTSVTAKLVDKDGRQFIEVSTPTEPLQRQFYHFSVAVAERIIVEKRPAAEAIELELSCFADLLHERPLLSTERQVGLIGELVFLELLIAKAGMRAVDSWIGPLTEPHDFRLGTHEFEVKTTVSTQRIHTINGTEQLTASAGCALYLASIVLGPPGAGTGFSLAQKVEQVSGILATNHACLSQFQTALRTAGFRTEDSQHYSKQFAMRRPVAIVPINKEFPAITRPAIQDMLGPVAARIEAVKYDVNVEGLERESSTPEFEAAISSW